MSIVLPTCNGGLCQSAYEDDVVCVFVSGLDEARNFVHFLPEVYVGDGFKSQKTPGRIGADDS
jgi:hypothetical protein